MIGAILMILYWVIIAPLKLISQGLSIQPFSAFSAMNPNPPGIGVWLFIHAFNIIILLFISYSFNIVFNFIKGSIANIKT